MAGQHTTAFLVDDDILVDAGTGVASLTLDEMRRIDHVFISHAHLDHILCLPLLLDAAGPLRGGRPVQVHALPETLDVLRRHIFNGHIWPDFASLPECRPYMTLEPLAVGGVVEAGGKRIEALPAWHSVPTVGYAASRVAAPPAVAPCWVFSSDTSPCPAFWERVNALHVGVLIIEAAFSDDEAELARVSGHMSPAVVAAELANLSGQPTFPIYIDHTKPAEAARIMAQLQQANGSRSRPLDVRWLATGQLLQV